MKKNIIDNLCEGKSEPSFVLQDYGVRLFGQWTDEEVTEIRNCFGFLVFRVPKEVIKEYQLEITKMRFNPELFHFHLDEHKKSDLKVSERSPSMGYALGKLSVGITAHARSDCGIFMPPLQVMNDYFSWAHEHKQASPTSYVWQATHYQQFLMHEIMHCFMYKMPGYISFRDGKQKDLGPYFQPWVDLEKKIAGRVKTASIQQYEASRPGLRALSLSYPTCYAETNPVETIAECFAYYAMHETFKEYDPWLQERIRLVHEMIQRMNKDMQKG